MAYGYNNKKITTKKPMKKKVRVVIGTMGKKKAKKKS